MAAAKVKSQKAQNETRAKRQPKKPLRKKRKSPRSNPGQANLRTDAQRRHEPDKNSRSLAMLGSTMGMPRELIASMIIDGTTQKPINRRTLEKYYEYELAHGREIILAGIAGTMVQVATDKKHPKCITAGIFLAKVWGRMRDPEPEWSERKRLADDAAADVDTGDIEIEAELILEEPKPPALPLPHTTVQ